MSTHATNWDKYRGTPAEIYQQYFVPAIGSPCARSVVDSVALRAGERVLDVACGTGVVARLAAPRVDPNGTVTGIDGNPDMLRVARSSTPAGTAIEWHQAIADGLPFDDDSFDVALCSVSLQFFADQVGAIREMRRVVAPGGRFAIGVPGPTPPLFEELRDLLADSLGGEVAAFIRAVFSIDDADRLQEIVSAAGLSEVSTTTRPIPVHLGPPADFFWQYMLGTPLAAAIAELDAHEREMLENEIVRRWSPFEGDDGLEVEIGLILATARRPA